MLFVHGAGGGGWEWNVWVRVFAAEGYLVHAPDLQPIAEGLEQTRLEDYSAQVRRQIETLRQALVAGFESPTTAHHDTGVARVVLIGASLGGLLAMMNAELADALVLVNPMPPTPLNKQLPKSAACPAIVPWSANASLAGTRRALPDADESACLFAFRRWRDESGAVMTAAQCGVEVTKPACPVLVLTSEHDADVPPTRSAELAQTFAADFFLIPNASHVGPLLGRGAAAAAQRTVAWLNGLEFEL